MKISITTHGFSGWGGGVDLIRHIAWYLMVANDSKDWEKQIILPDSDLLSQIKEIAVIQKKMLSDLSHFRIPLVKKRSKFSRSYFEETFSEFRSDYRLTFAGSTFGSQLKVARRSLSDVVLPLITPPPTNFSIPWVGYLYDFQHKYLPEFFTREQISKRNREFEVMLKRAPLIIVNAKSVADDAKKFYSGLSFEIFPIPFSPSPLSQWLVSDLDVRPKFGIKRRFFLISNQFWRHKDHQTAFRAFARYRNSGGKAILVCTGRTEDKRYPDYFRELTKELFKLRIENDVLILGHIPKIEQISLVKHAEAVVQPTLFEGGPGGGASYDAIALGIPVIASDIPVNREMNCGQVKFFEAGNVVALSDVLLNFSGAPQRIDNRKLWADGLSRSRVAGDGIVNALRALLSK